jgi:alkanesulfonate monooxygenase SsuD/methylene tetrahydromethanopterin reductase-like flavin-dependent oxidoreductase (luciferase family)
MKFGINFFPAFRPSQKTTAEYYAQCLRVSERADELGFSSIKAVEHYFHDYGGHSPNPIVLLAAIASRTKRLRPITGAVIPAFNHPIKLAGELAMLDNISNGRLDVGFGRAFIPEEYAAFGLDMQDSRARFDEGVAVIKRLWTEERVTHEGRFWRFKDVHSMPRPLQQPHPPIWIAAIASEESFVNAGEERLPHHDRGLCRRIGAHRGAGEDLSPGLARIRPPSRRRAGADVVPRLRRRHAR